MSLSSLSSSSSSSSSPADCLHGVDAPSSRLQMATVAEAAIHLGAGAPAHAKSMGLSKVVALREGDFSIKLPSTGALILELPSNLSCTILRSFFSMSELSNLRRVSSLWRLACETERVSLQTKLTIENLQFYREILKKFGKCASIASIVEMMPELREIREYFHDEKDILTPEELEEFITAIAKRKITKIHFGVCNTLFLSIIKACLLSLVDVRLDSEVDKTTCKALMACVKLEHLYINNGKKGKPMQLLPPSSLRTFDVNYTIDDRAAVLLAESCKHLKHLGCYAGALTIRGYTALAELHLTSIRLTSPSIDFLPKGFGNSLIQIDLLELQG